jgi:DNA-damage-inducible protein J
LILTLTPNTLRAAAIDELEAGNGKKANTIEELFNDLDVGSLK